MHNVLCQQIPPMNHTHFRCDVGDRFKNCASLLVADAVVNPLPHELRIYRPTNLKFRRL